MTKLTLTLAAALTASLVSTSSLYADEFEEGAEKNCSDRFSICMQTADDFTVAELVRLLNASGSSFEDTQEYIQYNGWESVEPTDVIPAGTSVRI